MKSQVSRIVTCLLVLGCGTGYAGTDLIGKAPERVTAFVNPYEGDEAAARAGGKLVAKECRSCHVEKGLAKAPRLDAVRVRDASAGALYWVLRNGSLHRGMPSFAHLPEAQRWQIVEYLKSNR